MTAPREPSATCPHSPEERELDTAIVECAGPCAHHWIAWCYDGKREAYCCDECNQEFALTPIAAPRETTHTKDEP